MEPLYYGHFGTLILVLITEVSSIQRSLNTLQYCTGTQNGVLTTEVCNREVPLYSFLVIFNVYMYMYIVACVVSTPVSEYTVPSSCTLCQAVLIVSTSDEKYRFGVPFKVLTVHSSSTGPTSSLVCVGYNNCSCT